MRRYRLRLTLLGPLGTGLTGDTLFGHLCWGIVYHAGRAALEDFLARMASAEPPLVIGDPVPAGFLPNPALPPPTLKEREDLEKLCLEVLQEEHRRRQESLGAGGLAGSPPGPPEVHDRLKRLAKAPWVPREVLVAHLDDLRAAVLLEALLQWERRFGPGSAEAPRLRARTVMHNTINRFTQHPSADGGLFALREYFPPTPRMDFDLYLLSSLPAGRIVELFRWGLAGGYGRDASTGRGRLEVGELDESPWPAASQPNAVLALGTFSPSSDDPAAGTWRLTVRLGKLGGAWAGDPEGPDHPFKYPLTLLCAGAVLGPPRRAYLGRIVPGVHPIRREVVTCAMAPVLSVRCPAVEAVQQEAN